MKWEDVASKIATIAPGLGTLFGPVGAGIGIGIKLLANAFGLQESEITPDKVDELIRLDPQAVIKLRLAEMDYKVKMREQDLVELKTQIEPYIEELKAKTIPWIDGLHKMGRQILNAYTISMVFVLLMTGHAVTPEAAALIGGPNMIYQFIKGKGEK